MPNIDELNAKQQELESTEQELRSTKDELIKKAQELENARLENEDKKSEFIKELMDEIKTLRERAESYEQQIKSISSQLIILREDFNNINQPTVEQTTVEQSTDQQIKSEEAIEEQTKTENTEKPVTKSEEIADQQTKFEESEELTTKSKEVDNQQTKSKENGEVETKSEEISNQQTKPEKTEELTTKSEEVVDQQTESEESIDENSSTYTTESIDQIDIHSCDWFLLVLNKLLDEIKDTKKWISKRWLSKAWKKGMNEAKNKLKQYEDILKGKKKTLLKQNKSGKVEIYNNDIAHIKNLFEELNKVREEIGMAQWGEYKSIASYLYNSPETARKSNKYQADNLEFNQKFQKELKNWAILQIFNWNTQKANEFFRRIAQWEYSAVDYQLFITNSAILTPCCQRYGIAIPSNPNWWGIDIAQRNPRRTTDYRNLDRWEAFQQWWVAWIIDKALSNCNNLTPWQRNTWKSIGVLWCYAAWIYWLYKFFTNKKMSFWGKALTTGWVIFWSQMLTWENPLSLFNKLMNWWLSRDELNSKFWNTFGDAVDWVHNSWIEGADNISWAMYSLMVFNKTTKVWEVRTLSTRFKNKPQEWDLFRLKAKENLGTKNFERFSATFSENFDEDKWNNWLNSIWIHEGIDDNKLVYELAGNKTMNTVVINKFLSDNWVKVTDNKTKKEEYEQYIKSINDNNQAIDIAVLEWHKNDRFMPDNEATFTDRPEDLQNKEKLNNQVDQLSIDEQIKSDLKNEIQLFYDERPIKNKPDLNAFSLEMDNNLLVLKSHNWEKTKINLQNKTLKWFWSNNANTNEIKFTKTKELLDTAYLTNDILARQKNKQIVNMPPFQYKQERKWICFNDVETLSLNFDTRILSTWRWWATSKIETLNNNLSQYAEYLSKRRIEQNKINIDATLYPTVKKLSESWIIFTNEQEVKDLEDWIKWIKENLKFAVSTPDWNPFSITFTNKLEFRAVNGDTQGFPENISEKFPTLLRTWNKEKFLKIMNDPNNKMRWSVHN